jgi:hypothetical protein
VAIVADFSDEGRCLIWTCTGLIRRDEAIDRVKELLNQPERAQALVHGLVEFAPDARVEMTTDDLRAVAAVDEQLAKLNRHLKVAVVAAQDYIYGMLRMWEVFVSDTGWNVHVFRHRAEAEAWLGKLPPPSEPHPP